MAQLQEGFRTLVTFAGLPGIALWEKRVKPPSLSRGGGISTTTMRVNNLHTMYPKTLVKIGDMSITAAYATQIYIDFFSFGNNNPINLVQVTWSDGSRLTYYGWLDEIDPAEISEGEQPTVTAKVIAANTNPILALTNITYYPPA